MPGIRSGTRPYVMGRGSVRWWPWRYRATLAGVVPAIIHAEIIDVLGLVLPPGTHFIKDLHLYSSVDKTGNQILPLGYHDGVPDGAVAHLWASNDGDALDLGLAPNATPPLGIFGDGPWPPPPGHYFKMYNNIGGSWWSGRFWPCVPACAWTDVAGIAAAALWLPTPGTGWAVYKIWGEGPLVYHIPPP